MWAYFLSGIVLVIEDTLLLVPTMTAPPYSHLAALCLFLLTPLLSLLWPCGPYAEAEPCADLCLLWLYYLAILIGLLLCLGTLVPIGASDARLMLGALI
jgi:hypothetical protein